MGVVIQIGQFLPHADLPILVDQHIDVFMTWHGAQINTKASVPQMKPHRQIAQPAPQPAHAFPYRPLHGLAGTQIVDLQLRAARQERLLHHFAKLPKVIILRFDSLPQIGANPLEAAYRNSLRLAKSSKIEMALDGFLDILRQDKHFHNDQLHEIYLALLEVLGDAYPTVRQYRDDLSNVLF